MAVTDYRYDVKPVISEEELPDVLVASQEDLRDAEEGLDESNRLIAMGEGLEDLSEIVASIESATPRDLVFVENGTRLALSGYDISVEAIFPSLESHHGGTISMEGVGNFIKQVWKSILKVIKRVWEDIASFFKRMYDVSERLKLNNKRLRERIMNLDNQKILDTHTDLGVEIGHLSSDGKLPKNGNDIEKLLDQTIHHAGVLYEKYVATIADAGIQLAEAVERFDIDNPDKSLQRIVDSAKRIDFEAIEKQAGGTKDDKDRRWEGNTVKVSKPLGKDLSIFFIEPTVRGSGDSVLGQSERLRNRRILLAKTRKGKDKKVSSGTIQTIPTDQMLKLNQRTGELLEQISNFRKSEVRVIRSRRRLEKACEKLTKRMESQRDLSTTAKQYYQSAVNFSVAYARWCTEPHGRFTEMAIAVSRASITACNKSISNYGTA